MSKTKIDSLVSLLKLLDQDYGNVLHLSVYIRDQKFFLHNQSSELLNQKHNDLTPIELAKKLNYKEFFIEEINYNKILKVIDPILYNNSIREAILEKYINPLLGYKKRNVKMTVNHFCSFSNKVTMIPIEEASSKIEKNKLVIFYNHKKYKFASDDYKTIEDWHFLLSSKEERIKEAEKLLYIKKEEFEACESSEEKESDTNSYLYVFLCKILANHAKDQKIFEELKNFELLNYYLTDKKNENSKSESFYSSSSDDFFDFDEINENFKIHRNSLPSQTCSSFEPLSFLQKLCEQFQFLHMVKNKDEDLNLFYGVISYILSSFSIYRERIKKCFDALIGETFFGKEKDFEFYIEKSDEENINMICFSKNLILMLNNTKVQIKFSEFIICFDYDIEKFNVYNKHEKNEFYNIFNYTSSVKMFKVKNDYKNREDYKQGAIMEIDEIHYMENLENSEILYQIDLIFKNDLVSGTLKKKNETFGILKGKWFEKVVINLIKNSKTDFVWENKSIVYPIYYNFNLYTMQLNYPIVSLKSDSRNREDIRSLENGNVNHSRECNEILKNREIIRAEDKNHFKSRFFKLRNNFWVFQGRNVKDNISFINEN